MVCCNFFHLFSIEKIFFCILHKMEQGFSCSTLALQNTDILEGIRKKKTDVICNSLPLGCMVMETCYRRHNFHLRQNKLFTCKQAFHMTCDNYPYLPCLSCLLWWIKWMPAWVFKWHQDLFTCKQIVVGLMIDGNSILIINLLVGCSGYRWNKYHL